jgi:hypothetical protein
VKQLLTAVLTLLMLISNSNLSQSVWVHKVGNGCTDTLKLLPKGRITDYDCEMNYISKGTYIQFRDTLTLTEKDDSHPEDGGTIAYYKEKYLIRENALYLVAKGTLVNDKWNYSRVKLTKSAWYKKIL